MSLQKKYASKSLNVNSASLSNKEIIYVAAPTTLLTLLNNELICHKERLTNVEYENERYKNIFNSYEVLKKKLKAKSTHNNNKLINSQLNIKPKKKSMINDQLFKSMANENTIHDNTIIEANSNETNIKENESEFHIRQLETYAEDNIMNITALDSKTEWVEILKNCQVTQEEFVELARISRNKNLCEIIELLFTSIVEKTHQLFLLRKENNPLHKKTSNRTKKTFD